MPRLIVFLMTPSGTFQLGALDACPDLLRYGRCLPALDVQKHDQELLAAEPDAEVRGADAVPDDVRGLLEHGVSRVVAVEIVDLLEIVEVAHDQAGLLLPAEDASWRRSPRPTR